MESNIILWERNVQNAEKSLTTKRKKSDFAVKCVTGKADENKLNLHVKHVEKPLKPMRQEQKKESIVALNALNPPTFGLGKKCLKKLIKKKVSQ